MKTTLIATAVLTASALAMSASATPLSFWHFNDTSNLGTSLFRINPLGAPDSMSTYASDLGPMSAHISVWGGGVTDGTLVGTNGVESGTTANNFGSFAGTSNGDQGFGAGGSLSIIGPDNNSAYFTITFSDAVSHLGLSYWTRGTGTGFDTHIIHYSTDGGQTINTLATLDANQTATWDEVIIDFGSIFAGEGNGMNVIYIEVDGATGTTGNNRFDNISLFVVPSPGALALLGVAGLIGCRRRRAS